MYVVIVSTYFRKWSVKYCRNMLVLGSATAPTAQCVAPFFILFSSNTKYGGKANPEAFPHPDETLDGL